MHVVMLVARGVVLKVPGWQGVQLPDLAALHVPGGHSLHWLDFFGAK